MTRRHTIILAAALALIAGAALLAWPLALRPPYVRIAQVQRDVAVQVFGLGTIEARVQSKIGFEVSGVLVELTADLGDRVAKGAVLARLDSREQASRLARAKAAVAQAEANLQRATARVEKAEANYANTQSISRRRQTLVATAIASVETAETAVNAERASAAELNLAKSDMAVTRRGPAIH